MTTIRTFFRKRLELAVLIVLVAMAMKAVVPAGYMVMADADGGMIIGLCPGVSFAQTPKNIMMQHNSAESMTDFMQHNGQSDGGHHNGGNGDAGACAYTALVHAALDNAIPPVLLAAAFAYIVSLGLFFRVVTKRLPVRYAQPPSHAPPFSA